MQWSEQGFRDAELDIVQYEGRIRVSVWYKDLVTLDPPMGILSSDMTRNIERLVIVMYLMYEETFRLQLGKAFRVDSVCIIHRIYDIS